MIIVDGENIVLGRLASFVAKQALKGEEIKVVNSEKVIVSGSRTDIQRKFREKRSKVGSGQKGPKVSRSTDKIVKRAIRGMLPNHREGRGREAFKKIKCYNGIPNDLQNEKILKLKINSPEKSIKVKEIYK